MEDTVHLNHEHGCENRKSTELRGNGKRRSKVHIMYASLKIEINYLMKIFHIESDKVEVNKNISGPFPERGTPQLSFSPTATGTHNSLMAFQNRKKHSAVTVKRSFHPITSSTENVEGRYGNMLAMVHNPDDYLIERRHRVSPEVQLRTTPTGNAQRCVSLNNNLTPQKTVDIGLRENLFRSFSLDRPTSAIDGNPGEIQACSDALYGANDALGSYFDDSEDETLASHRLAIGRRLSRVKDSTKTWVQKTFNMYRLDEAERAFFKMRRSQSSHEPFEQRPMPNLFTNGKSIKPGHPPAFT